MSDAATQDVDAPVFYYVTGVLYFIAGGIVLAYMAAGLPFL
jgi:hypothetical protein